MENNVIDTGIGIPYENNLITIDIKIKQNAKVIQRPQLRNVKNKEKLNFQNLDFCLWQKEITFIEIRYDFVC